MKRILLITLVLVVAMAVSADAFTFTRRQVTTSELKQTNPVMSGSSVYWKQLYSGSESNIWRQDVQTGHEQPVVERLGEKTPIAASGDYLVYHEYKDETNWYDTGIYNSATGEDKVIASGPESQVAQDIWGNRVIYNTGDTWPDLYLYDIATGETSFVASEAIRPRIWGDNIAYIKSYGSGYSTIEVYNLATGVTTQVPTTNDHNQTLPDIYQDKVVWSGLNDNLGIFYRNLTSGEERKISDSGQLPVVWGDFIAWSQDDGSGLYDIYAHNLISGETQKVSGDAKTSGWEPYGAPYLYENTVLWTSGVSNGYGNIFAAELSVPEPSSLIVLGVFLTPLLFRRRR